MRGKERRNGPWSDENILSEEKRNVALGEGVGSEETEKKQEWSGKYICPHTLA